MLCLLDTPAPSPESLASLALSNLSSGSPQPAGEGVWLFGKQHRLGWAGSKFTKKLSDLGPSQPHTYLHIHSTCTHYMQTHMTHKHTLLMTHRHLNINTHINTYTQTCTYAPQTTYRSPCTCTYTLHTHLPQARISSTGLRAPHLPDPHTSPWAAAGTRSSKWGAPQAGGTGPRGVGVVSFTE